MNITSSITTNFKSIREMQVVLITNRDSVFMEQWWKKYMNDYLPYVIYARRDSKEGASVSGNGGYKVFFKDGSGVRIEAI